MFIDYAFFTVLNLLFTILSYILAPFIAPFTQSNGYLPNWLSWFQTQEAPLDAGWKDGYFVDSLGIPYDTPPVGLELYWLRVLWLWRNPAYGFCYWPLGIVYNPDDWVIKTLAVDPITKEILELYAYTKDWKYFCYTNSRGLKLGYKLWWAFDPDNQMLARVPAAHGPDNRLPMCFTPW
jgi:hypothetical protein